MALQGANLVPGCVTAIGVTLADAPFALTTVTTGVDTGFTSRGGVTSITVEQTGEDTVIIPGGLTTEAVGFADAVLAATPAASRLIVDLTAGGDFAGAAIVRTGQAGFCEVGFAFAVATVNFAEPIVAGLRVFAFSAVAGATVTSADLTRAIGEAFFTSAAFIDACAHTERVPGCAATKSIRCAYTVFTVTTAAAGIATRHTAGFVAGTF